MTKLRPLALLRLTTKTKMLSWNSIFSSAIAYLNSGKCRVISQVN